MTVARSLTTEHTMTARKLGVGVDGRGQGRALVLWAASFNVLYAVHVLLVAGRFFPAFQ